jgi:hypothetical protein
LSELKRLWESVEKLRIDFLTFVKLEEKRWEEVLKRFKAIEKTLAEHSMRLDRIEKIVYRIWLCLVL